MYDDLPAWNTTVRLVANSFVLSLNLSHPANTAAATTTSDQPIELFDPSNELPSLHNVSGDWGGDGLRHAPTFTSTTSMRVVVLAVMAACSLLGNAATMWNIQQSCSTRRVTRHSWSAVYFLIFHLALADLLVTLFCICGEAAWSFTVEWRAGQFACKALKFTQMFSLYLSTFVLVLIGVDRWIAVKYPWKSLYMMKRSYRFIGVAYVLAAVLSVPQLVIFDVVKGPFVEEFYQCVTYNFYTDYWQEQAYTTFTLMFMFVLPLIILITTYVATFQTIAASERMFSVSSSNGDLNGMDRGQSRIRQQLISRAKIKSLRISVVIVLAFIVCWSPYYVMMLIFMFLNPNEKYSDGLQSAIFFFGMSNSVVNPLIYGAFNLWPMRQKQRIRNAQRSSFTKEASTHKTGLSTQGTTTRHQESRMLYTNGRNISDSSITATKPVDPLLSKC